MSPDEPPNSNSSFQQLNNNQLLLVVNSHGIAETEIKFEGSSPTIDLGMMKDELVEEMIK